VRLLLDSHAFLWMAEDSPRLTARARRRIGDVRSERYLSAGSVWELAIKDARGALRLPMPFGRVIDESLHRLRIKLLPIEATHALEAASLPLHHRDLFDRLLVAQARCEQLTLVTADRRLEAYDVPILRAA
jgi:PIN domain nuclease of toxin-antitoxin system